MLMKNIPSVKPAIIAVSRDCFPRTLSERRRIAVAAACNEKNIPLYECSVIVETERQADAALAEVKAAGCNALVVYCSVCHEAVSRAPKTIPIDEDAHDWGEGVQNVRLPAPKALP